MMDPVAKRAWVDALRSGEYKQAQAQLCTNDGKMCCLGVLYDVAIDGVWEVDDYGPRYGMPPTPENHEWNWAIKAAGPYGKHVLEASELPDAILRKVGLTRDDQNDLINMNDVQRKRFPTIANWIEKNL